MSEEKEMTLADESRQMPRCAQCRMVKISMNGHLECPNCYGDSQPKTGQTMVVHEGPNGGVKLEFVPNLAAAAAPPAKAAQAVQVPNLATASQPGLILINVPVELFAELVVWSRKLKLPKNWADAAKMKAIVDFQVHLMSKLTELK